MRIRSVTVGLGLTESLPGYGNVKPSLTLTADLDPGEDANAVVETLDARVRAYVEEKVDRALEAAGEEPKYYDGPLYRLARWKQRDALVVLPADVSLDDLPGDWSRVRSGMRLETARRVALHRTGTREVLEHDHDSLHELQEWWDARRWYAIYALPIWEDRWTHHLGRGLCVRHGLQIPRQVKELDGVARELESAILVLEHYDLDEWDVVEDQQALDELVDGWLEEHPQPGRETTPVEYPNDDDWDDGEEWED